MPGSALGPGISIGGEWWPQSLVCRKLAAQSSHFRGAGFLQEDDCLREAVKISAASQPQIHPMATSAFTCEFN